MNRILSIIIGSTLAILLLALSVFLITISVNLWAIGITIKS